VLHAAVLLDLSVSAVMVGQEQSFRGNHFSCAASSKQYDRILEGCLIDAVDVICSELESLCLHVVDALRDERRQPHSFVCPCCNACQNSKRNSKKMFFHIVFYKLLYINLLYV